MYEPVFNSVLVEIDDREAKWGKGNNDEMLGKSYSKGTVIESGGMIKTNDYPHTPSFFNNLKGRKIMWNEGHEAGTTFEFDNKLFGMVYWWDIRGVLVDENATKVNS